MKREDWERVQDTADRFEDAWQQVGDRNEAIDLGDFLPPTSDPLRSTVLQELIKSDLEIRFRRAKGVGLEFYLKRFPELGATRTLSSKLIYEEYRVRQLFGDKPELSLYQTRFPNQFDELQRLLQEQPVPTIMTPTSTPVDKEPPVLPPSGGSDFLQVGGGYKLIKQIGTGSFGSVWKAEAPGGVPVAIKIIMRPFDHEEAKRELQSLETIKKLSHPFLLQTQAYWPLQDRLLIVMELADGTLRDGLKKYRQLGQPGYPLDELVGYFREAAEALDYLHGENVMHRDIKPDNILIQRKHAKVADFGLAKVLGTTKSITASGCGTPAYMAPEVWRNKVHANSDQYSLAVSYAELRLGRRLFAGQDMMSE